jgi:hypothetical protein
MLLGVEVVDETTKELFVCLSINFIPLVCMVSGIISVMFVPPHRHVLQGTDDFTEGVSFPPKTGPLFLETEGGCDGSETLFG